MLKRFTLLILSAVIVLSSFAPAFSASAADSTKATLVSLVKKFPQGKYWNHMGSDENSPDNVTEIPCETHKNCSWKEGACSCNSFDKAIQCMGYAHKVAYDITGVLPRTFDKITTLSVSKLRVGDVIRFRNDGHSICVTGVDGNNISFTDCNWDYKCGIRWGVMDISYIKARGFTYVLHLEGNNRKNTDLDFYEGIEPDEKKPVEEKKSEIWQMCDSNLNIRKEASAYATIVGKIPANAKYKVYAKKTSADYLWGKVEYNGVSGWVALNFSEYIKGKYDVPEFIGVDEKYYSREITFKWNAVSGADSYKLYITDEDGKKVKESNTKKNECTVKLSEDGKYFVNVKALNSFCKSWKNVSGKVGFTVKYRPPGSVTQINLSNSTKNLAKGKSFTLTANIFPEDTTDKKLIFKSSDEKVATVSNQGTVTAVSYGKAVITCTSSDGEIKDHCQITVIPNGVKNPEQITGGTTETSIKMKWDKVSGVDGYKIKRYDPAKKDYVAVATVKTNSYTDKNVSAGKKYAYKVCAYVKIDSVAIAGKEVTGKMSTVPAKVNGVKQTASSSDTVTIEWEKATNATSYIVYKYDSKTNKFVKYKSTKNTSIKLSQSVNSSDKYRVKAITETKWGILYGKGSSTVTAITGPEKVIAKLANTGTGKVKISWGKVSHATHYQIYRLQSGEYKKIATVASGNTTFTNTSLKSKTTYQYKVRAIKVKDKKTYYGSFSDAVKIKTK